MRTLGITVVLVLWLAPVARAQSTGGSFGGGDWGGSSDYGGGSMSQAMAQGTFGQLTVDARARFRRELVRNADGRVETQDARAPSPKAHEGEGVVVVTVVVAARRELLDVGRATDANELARLLSELSRLEQRDLVALEVIWSPAAEDDRMSTAELVALYPSLARMDEQTVGGRVFCAYCSAPFAHELTACPHCGAPSPRDAAA